MVESELQTQGGGDSPSKDISATEAGGMWHEAYQDILSPTMKAIGGDLLEFYNVLRRAVRNPEYRDLQQRYREFLDSTVARVPELDRQLPPEQILGPVLEAKRYEPNGTPVSEMFAELLSRAFNKQTVSAAHPAFPALIAQLSSDEAKVLIFGLSRLTPWKYGIPAISGPFSEAGRNESTESCRAKLNSPENLRMYLDHLLSLGILQNHKGGPPDGTPVFYLFSVQQTGHLMFTDFGRAFMNAVTSLPTTETGNITIRLK